MLKIKKKLRRNRILRKALLPTSLIAVMAAIANLLTMLFSVPTANTYITDPTVITPTVNITPKGFWQSIPSIYEEPKDIFPIDAVVEIPEGMGLISQQTLKPTYDNRSIGLTSSGYILNLTQLPNLDVLTTAEQPFSFIVEPYSSEPQVLIYHTHATESYEPNDVGYYDPAIPSRNDDPAENMIAIGEVIVDVLNDAGINTLHDKSMHDQYSYNGSYDSSLKTVSEYLLEYPSIKVVLDVHRDALEQSDGTRIKPVVMIDGKKAAQVMLISGADDGEMGMPNYLENLKFASAFQSAMEGSYEGLTRPILFDYRNYNQQLSTGALLLEVGGHANTLEEAKNAAEFAATALAELLISGT